MMQGAGRGGGTGGQGRGKSVEYKGMMRERGKGDAICDVDKQVMTELPIKSHGGQILWQLHDTNPAINHCPVIPVGKVNSQQPNTRTYSK